MYCNTNETNDNEKINNKNEFGWWIMNECENNIISSQLKKNSQNSNFHSFSNSLEIENDNDNLKNLEDFNLNDDDDDLIISLKKKLIPNNGSQRNSSENNENKGKIEKMELTLNVDFDKIQDERENFIENDFRKSLGFSYTPERLVKSKEYKILSPPFQSACIHSSKFRQRKLSELIDPHKIGGINLQKLLCPNIMAINYSNYFHMKRYIDFQDIKSQSKEGSFSSLISNFKELKTLSEEKQRNRKFSSSEEENTSGIQSPGWSLDTCSEPTKALPRVENLKGSSNEEDIDDYEIESSEISTILLDDSENLSEIQSKIKKLENNNGDMQKNIETLKEDFQNDEWKINILLEDAINLRREIQELQYLDNLVNLLRGELERISPKTWPFIRNHVDPYSEEINLII
ncbi:hybrid signal transduction histidine kinase D-like [Leptopilina boulardi]|uniref:hybrid signal transduction histidine kinase D-like n=1 Tax=Leptopilina boulardi TaxID=63433 RepID=UPI0021F61400|nr:hybrid signal transduction histidine kinase D-like [Leptopilina boulardi]